MSNDSKQEDAARLTAHDYQRALDVQDACNLSGVVRSFSQVMDKVWGEARATGNASTDWVNRHPIAVLYASKVQSLTGGERDEAFSAAYDICKMVAG